MKQRRTLIRLLQTVLVLSLATGLARADFLHYWPQNRDHHNHDHHDHPRGHKTPADPPSAASLAIVAADNLPNEISLQQALEQTGRFSSVTVFDASATVPSLAALTPYSDVLVWTAGAPASGLGNVLASYYDLGGKGMTIAGYGFSVPPPIFPDPALTGTIAQVPYAGFTETGLAQPSGQLLATVPNDPIFSGIDLNPFTYSANGNSADTHLAQGATLLATDGNGLDMIARSADGIVDLNLYPPFNDTNSQFIQLLANTFPGGGGGPSSGVPEPSALVMLLGGLGAIVWGARRER